MPWFIFRTETDQLLVEQNSKTATSAKLGLGTLFSGFIAFGLGLVIGDGLYDVQHPKQRGLVSEVVPRVVAERIICAESNGDPNAKNKRSSATGPAQFIDETWLYMIRVHRPDFAQMSNKDALELRRDPELAREMTMRLLERNATMLKRRKLPITAGTLYLSHFAGGAGAVALLLAADADDAASVMARADVTGQTTRERLVRANPFLNSLTIADLKSWADNKMRRSPGQSCHPAVSPAAVRGV
jgi:hypothetical protein